MKLNHILLALIATLIVDFILFLSLDEHKSFENRLGEEYNHCITSGYPESACNQHRQEMIDQRNKFLNRQ